MKEKYARTGSELEQILSRLRQISLKTLRLPILSSRIKQNDDQNILRDVEERLERDVGKDQFSLEDTIDEELASMDFLEFLPTRQGEDAITMDETTPRRKRSEFEDLIPDFFGEASALENFPLDLTEESQLMSIVDVHPSEEPLQYMQTKGIASAVDAVSREAISKFVGVEDMNGSAEISFSNENVSETIIAPKNAFGQFQTSTPVYLDLTPKPLRMRKKRLLKDLRTTLHSSVIRKQLDNYSSTVLPLEKLLRKERNEESLLKEEWMKQPGMRIQSWRLVERYQQTLSFPNLTEVSRNDLVSEAILKKPTVAESFADVVQSNTESSLEVQRGRTLDSTGILRNVGSSDEMMDSVRYSKGLVQMQSSDENFHWQNSDAAGQLEHLAPLYSTGVTELIAYNREEKDSLNNVVEPNNSHFDDQLLKKVYEMAKNKDYVTFADLCPRETTTRKTAALVFNSLLTLHSGGKLSVAQGDYMSDIRIWTSSGAGYC